jgi:restriction endonuclease Mrr
MIPRAGEIETRLREHYGDGAVYETRRVIKELAAHFQLTPHDLAEWDGSHLRFEHKVHSALARHCRLELLGRPERGSFCYVPVKLAKYEPHHHPARGRGTDVVVRKMANRNSVTLSNDFEFTSTKKGLKLDEHDAALVAAVKAALDAAIHSARMPSAVAKRIHSIAARHRMKGRHGAIKRHPFAGVCEVSGRPLDKQFAQLDELDPELGYAGRVRWVCSRANNNGHHSCGGCK